MADVFVSYKREDRSAVERVVLGLRSSGFSVWWDVDIAPQAPWEATIEEQLREARTVVVAWSGHSVVSENVKAEARSARHDGRLVQIFLDDCDPPLFFGERQGIDLSQWSGAPSDAAWRALLIAVRRAAHGEPPALVAARRKSGNAKGRFAILATLLVAGGSVAWFATNWEIRVGAVGDEITLAAIEGAWGRPGCPSPQRFSASGGAITVRANGWTSTGRVVSVRDGAILSETISPVEERGRLIELRPEGDRLLLHDRTTDVRQVLERCP